MLIAFNTISGPVHNVWPSEEREAEMELLEIHLVSCRSHQVFAAGPLRSLVLHQYFVTTHRSM